MSAPAPRPRSLPPLATALVLLGSLVMAFGLHRQWEALAVTNFLVTEGQIRQVEAVRLGDPADPGPERWEARVTYAYPAGDTMRESHAYGSAGDVPTFPSKAAAEAYLEGYPVTSWHPVHVDPQDPTQVYREFTTGLGFLQLAGAGALAVLAGVAMALREALRADPSPPTPGS